MAENRRIGADLRPARGGVAIGPQMIVEPPVAHALAQQQQLERLARVAAMGHHAVGRRQMGERLPPFALLVANAHARSIARREHVAAAQCLAGPLAFDLDFRVARERRGRGLRQAEIDGVAVIVTRKAELEADRGFPNGALHRMLAAFDRAREAFGAGPERGLKTDRGSTCRCRWGR
jgi:hypothetical protein